MSIKTLCDKCGKEIKALSTRIRADNNTGIEVLNGRVKNHVCAECIAKLLNDSE